MAAKFKVGNLVQFKRGRGWSNPSLLFQIEAVEHTESKDGRTSTRYRVSGDGRWHSEDKIRFAAGS